MTTRNNDYEEAIVVISISAKTETDKVMAEKVLAAIRGMDEFRTDRAELDKDTRRGGFSFRYETFVFHVNP
jgi:hypothetical protein